MFHPIRERELRVKVFDHVGIYQYLIGSVYGDVSHEFLRYPLRLAGLFPPAPYSLLIDANDLKERIQGIQAKATVSCGNIWVRVTNDQFDGAFSAWIDSWIIPQKTKNTGGEYRPGCMDRPLRSQLYSFGDLLKVATTIR